jgi:hypothetical protein
MSDHYKTYKDSIYKSREKNKDAYKEYMREYQKKRYHEKNKDIIEERLTKRINKFLIEADKLGYTVLKNEC